jgi:glycosyltransferase involved in cell wall biosynthesis
VKLACISASQVPAQTANSIQVMKACQALAQLGHDVELMVPGSHAAPWEDLAPLYGLTTRFKITWIPTQPAWKHYDLAWKAVRRARASGAEAVYTWMLQAAWLATRGETPTLLEVHDRITGRVGPWLYRGFLRSRGEKRLLLITDALRRRLGKDFGALRAEKQVVITPNGVDLERFTALPDAPAARQALGLPERLTAVYSGSFYSGRGVELLFALAAAFPQTGFVWVGGRENDLQRLRQRLADEGLQNVHLTGFVPNQRLPLYQAAGDVLLMPYERAIAGSSGGNSAEICSPMKMFDYMASGRAILTSDLPVLREVLNEHNAVFCPPEDVHAWQAALQGLLGDAQQRAALGRQARADVERYTWLARERRALEGFLV